MAVKTFIQGKQAALEDSIQKMLGLLEKLGFQVQANEPLNPVVNIYSQHIYEKSCPGLFTNGKGSCEKATYASALGEYLERLSTNYFFSDYYLQTPDQSSDDGSGWLYYLDEKVFDESSYRQMLSSELWDFYRKALRIDENDCEEPDDFEFSDFLSFNDHSEQIRAIPLMAMRSGSTVYFPMNLLSNLYASNGLSAGNTSLEAQIQGLSEIFERWVKNHIFKENLCIPEVPHEVLNAYPVVMRAIEALQAEGFRVSVRDASLGGVYPVLNVTLINPKEGNCFASFGSHPLFEVALERTLTESLQGRHLNNLDGFQTPVHDAFLVAQSENLENHFIDSSGLIHSRFISDDYDFEFNRWPELDSMEAQWEYLCEKVWQQGTDIYIGHYEQFGFNALRIVVPGMSEVYPLQEMVENNQNYGRLLREALFRYTNPNDCEILLDRMDQLGFSGHQGVASLIGLMPDKWSFWGQMTVSQLRFWCYLVQQEFDLALESAQEVMFYLHKDNPWYLWFKACLYILESMEQQQLDLDQMNLSDFRMLFGEEVSENVIKHLKGQEVFYGHPPGKEIFINSTQHRVMLEIYQRLRAFKQNPINNMTG